MWVAVFTMALVILNQIRMLILGVPDHVSIAWYFELWAAILVPTAFAFAWLLWALRHPNRIALIMPMVLAVVSLIILGNAVLFEAAGIRNVARGVIHDGFAGLYLSVMTITTVGYGDFVPATDMGRLFAMTEAFSGYLLMAILISTILEWARRGASR